MNLGDSPILLVDRGDALHYLSSWSNKDGNGSTNSDAFACSRVKGGLLAVAAGGGFQHYGGKVK